WTWDWPVGGLEEGRSARLELVAPRVETEDMHLVQSLVGHHHEAAGKIEDGLMGMRTMLLVPPRSRLAGRHDIFAGWGERPIVVDREQRHTGTGGKEHAAPVCIHHYGRRIVSTRWLLVEQPEPAGLPVPRVGADLRAVAVRRIEKSLAGIQRYVARVRNRIVRFDLRPSAARGIDPEHGYALAARLAFCAREAADVGERRPCGSLGIHELEIGF